MATRKERPVLIHFSGEADQNLLRRLLAYSKMHACSLEDEIKTQLGNVVELEEE